MGGGASKVAPSANKKDDPPIEKKISKASEKYLAEMKQNEQAAKSHVSDASIRSKRKSTLPKQEIRRISIDLASKSYINELQSIQGYMQFLVKKIVNVDDMDTFRQKYGYFSILYSEDTFISEKLQRNGEWNECYPIIIKKPNTSVYLRCGDKDMDQLLGRGEINLMKYIIRPNNSDPIDVYIPLDESIECSNKPINHVACIHVVLQMIGRDDLYMQFYKALLDIYTDGDSLNEVEVISIMDEIGHSSTDDALNRIINDLKNESGIITKDRFVKYLISPEFISEPMAYSMLSYVLYGETDVYNMLSSLYNTIDDETSKHITIGKVNPQESIDTIYYRDRDSCLTAIEYIPRYITMIYHLLHSYNSNNKNIQNIYDIINKLTTCEGLHYSSAKSVRYIKPFIEKYNIPTDCWTEPIEKYRTFNEFLARKIDPDSRPLDFPDNKNSNNQGIFSCSADSKVTVFATVNEAASIWIKGNEFSIKSLLGERGNELAPLFEGCSIVINRLALQDYHHFHFPINGKLVRKTMITGKLQPLHPLYLRTPEDNPFTTNTRHILEIDNPAFGLVVMIPVGSCLFGSIKYVDDISPPCDVQMGQDCGYFQYGGSAIITLIQRDKIKFDADLLENTKKLIETLVMCNKKIGISSKLDDAN